MAIQVFRKDPDATLDYTIDWEEWLNGDTVASMQYVAPTGITVETAMCSTTGTTSVLWVSGGTTGMTYDIVCRITTAMGRIDDRTLRFKIREK